MDLRMFDIHHLFLLVIAFPPRSLVLHLVQSLNLMDSLMLEIPRFILRVTARYTYGVTRAGSYRASVMPFHKQGKITVLDGGLVSQRPEHQNATVLIESKGTTLERKLATNLSDGLNAWRW